MKTVITQFYKKKMEIILVNYFLHYL